MLTSSIKREFTPEQITQVVVALGSAAPRRGVGGELIFQTVCHNHDGGGSHKLYFYSDKCSFHCYTQCGDSFDLYELVMRSRKCSFRAALEFIEGLLGFTSHRVGFTPDPVLTEDWTLLDRYAGRRRGGTIEPYKPLNPSILGAFSDAPPLEWQADGITPDAMRRFNIRLDITSREIIIPHYDIQGQLIGIRSRSFDPARVAAGNKYMPTVIEGLDCRHTLRNNLYGLHKTKEAIQRIGKVMIYESEKAVLQCDSFYGDKNFSVAVCGSNVSVPQRNLILGLGVREVFLGFDREYVEAYTPESDKYAQKILHIAAMFTPFVTVNILWDVGNLLRPKDSPTDRGREVLETLMRQKFEVGTDETTEPSDAPKRKHGS